MALKTGRFNCLDRRLPFQPLYGVGRGLLMIVDGLVEVFTLGVVMPQLVQRYGWRMLQLEELARGRAQAQSQKP